MKDELGKQSPSLAAYPAVCDLGSTVIARTEPLSRESALHSSEGIQSLRSSHHALCSELGCASERRIQPAGSVLSGRRMLSVRHQAPEMRTMLCRNSVDM